MPLKSFKCSICGAPCLKKYLYKGQFGKRMAWLRRHRKRKHPKAFRKSVLKARDKALTKRIYRKGILRRH